MYPVLACKLRWKKEVLLTNFRKNDNSKQFKSEMKVKKMHFCKKNRIMSGLEKFKLYIEVCSQQQSNLSYSMG